MGKASHLDAEDLTGQYVVIIDTGTGEAA